MKIIIHSDTLLEIYNIISNFNNVFSPSKPNDWIKIQQDSSSKELYYGIISCGYSKGDIINFGKLSIAGFPSQDWAWISTDLQI